MSPMNMLNRFRQWLAESRHNQFLAASAAFVAVGAVAAVGVVLAVSGDGDRREEVIARTATPSPAVETPTRSPRRTATASPTLEADRPALESLLQPGYVLDQALDVNLDGSETGQIVVISHTVRKDKTGLPATAAVPEECPDNSVLRGDLSPCAFRMEIFGYDSASGWLSRYVEGDGDPKQGARFADGITQAVEVTAFGPSIDGPQALVLTYANCGASNCPVQGHLVLVMKDGAIAAVYAAFDSSVQIEGNSAAFALPFYAQGPLSSGLCCPNGILVQTVEIDPQSRDSGVVAAELDVCAEGTIITAPAEPQKVLFVRCLDPNDPAYSPPRHVGGFETTEQTVVEPATVSGLQGLAEGDRVRVEYTVKECPQSLLDCSPGSITPIASKITVLNP